jgi:hypothetical protein
MTNHHDSPSQFDDQLSAYIDQQLSPIESQYIEAQVEVDSVVAQDLRELRYVVQLVREMPPVPVPRAFTLSEDMVGPQGVVAPGWLAWLQPQALRVAAALVALCLLLFVVGDLAYRNGFLPLDQGPTVGGLTAEEGDPTAVLGKVPTTEEPVASPSLFLGLSSQVVLALQVGLAVLLTLLLIASWRLARAP